MAGIYIYSDKLDIAAELVGFAKGEGKKAALIVMDQEMANQAKALGADEVCLFSGAARPENYGKAIAAYLKEQDAELFAVGSTCRGRELAASVAGYLDCAMSSDVVSAKYDGGRLVTRKMTLGGVVETEEAFTGLSVITVSAGKFQPVSGGESPVVEVAAQPDGRAQLTAAQPIEKTGVDLTKAEKIVSIGMGLDKQEDIQIARDLADVLGAEIGCSRGVAEERHWLPESNYVGITGTQVKAKLYLAMGISGQVQHVYGIKDVKVVVAINKDENAPIFRAADYGIVGDLYQYAPLLTEALKNL